jgi:DNA-binding winged helix-turn-helix (wHTH) protein
MSAFLAETSHMQTPELQCAPSEDEQYSAAYAEQAHCSLLDAYGQIDVTAAPLCEGARRLIEELRSLRASHPVAGWRLDRMGRMLHVAEQRVRLTRTQVSIIGVLAHAQGEFVPAYELLMGVWGFAQPIGGGELVRTHIRGIRRRLRECQVADDFINGSRGRGYRINPRFGTTAATPIPRRLGVAGAA